MKIRRRAFPDRWLVYPCFPSGLVGSHPTNHQIKKGLEPFLSAPVPSGYTFSQVQSRATVTVLSSV